MKLFAGMLIAIAGVAIMVWTYRTQMRVDPAAPHAASVIYRGRSPDATPAQPLEFPHFTAQVRELPLGQFGAALTRAFDSKPELAERLKAQLSEKLWLLDPQAAGIGALWLARGRLPRAGHDEVLAGYQASQHARLALGDRQFTVVGVVRRDVTFWSDGYLLPPHQRMAALFTDAAAGHPVWFLQLDRAQLHDPDVQKKLAAVFPAKSFAVVATPMVGVDRAPYYLYLSGQGLLLLGGVLALFAMYGAVARRVGWSVLRDPLAEMAARPKLLAGFHLAYFGLTLAAAALVYDCPLLQKSLLAIIQQAAAEPNNPLAAAGKAYGSHNMLLAAAVTFKINFLLGTLVAITLPALLVPTSGAFFALLRATVWGTLLAPTGIVLALAMLPHAGTLLLEGEAYILAGFFGLLVPLYLFEPDKGRSLVARYGRALLLNLKALVLIALVLAAAAGYEAVEVILMHTSGG